jgi:hypothetical protein
MSNIAGGTTLTTSLVQTGDTTGNLVFQTNGTTTALTLTTAQNANFANSVSAVGNVTGGNVITAGLVSLSSITKTGTDGVGNIGATGSTFNTIFAKATSAQYADLAEMYVADADYAPGTVVEFGGEYEITATTHSHTTRIAGVVSTSPAHLMNSQQSGTHVLPVALTGRVPCLVVGHISKGDRLVASDLPGVAQALTPDRYEPGSIVGKALQDRTGNVVGVIEIAVGRY